MKYDEMCFLWACGAVRDVRRRSRAYARVDSSRRLWRSGGRHETARFHLAIVLHMTLHDPDAHTQYLFFAQGHGTRGVSSPGPGPTQHCPAASARGRPEGARGTTFFFRPTSSIRHISALVDSRHVREEVDCARCQEGRDPLAQCHRLQGTRAVGWAAGGSR